MLRHLTNGEQDTLQILHHIVVGKAKHAVPARCKPLIAALIVANTLLEIMALAIDLDDELAGVRDEIGNVVANGALSAKSDAAESIRLQVAP